MKRNKLQKTVFSVICIVLAVIMMLSLVITVLPAHAVDETDLERLAEKRAQLEEQLMEQEQVIQGLTENQTLIVFRKAALDKQISLNRETIALIEEQIAVYQELIDRKPPIMKGNACPPRRPSRRRCCVNASAPWRKTTATRISPSFLRRTACRRSSRASRT